MGKFMQVVKAVGLAKKERPDLLIEGPMQVFCLTSIEQCLCHFWSFELAQQNLLTALIHLLECTDELDLSVV